MKRTLVIFILLVVSSCNSTTEKNKFDNIAIYTNKPILTNDVANYLYQFAFECLDQEYPNKLGQVLGDSTYLKQPATLHPAFYGCFDWHSAVHGHWTLLNLINTIPNFEYKEAILKKLNATITKENILVEVAYFKNIHNQNFERTYGWAWLLKLVESSKDGNSEEGKQFAENLLPLEDLIVQKFMDFLPKLKYPIRVGEHTNTAFALSFALDYAEKYDSKLAALIKTKSKEFYFNDVNCPLGWEPSGFDFLSPCLIEASLMLKVLPPHEFKKWFNKFMPGFSSNPENYMKIAEVTDRSDGKLAHLDGLNFSRAWCMYEIGEALQNKKIISLANAHFNYSYKKMDSGEYAGTHWLASFALYALLKSN